MKALSTLFLIVLWFAGCSGPAVPKWKSDTQSYLESYKNARLSASEKEAEVYKIKAIHSAKKSMDIDYLQIIELTDVAMSKVLLKDPELSAYEHWNTVESIPANNSYKVMLTNTLHADDISHLPASYQSFAEALLIRDKSKAFSEALKIENALSRLIALGILATEKDTGTLVYESMLMTAQTHGYSNVILAVLPKLSDLYHQSGEVEKEKKVNLLLFEMKRR